MSAVEMVFWVMAFFVCYFVCGFGFWSDVIDWKKAGVKEFFLIIFWFPVIFTILIVFIVQEIFSFVMKKVKKRGQKVKSYSGAKLFENNRLKVYFNKHNFGLAVLVDRPVFAIQFLWFTIFVNRKGE